MAYPHFLRRAGVAVGVLVRPLGGDRNRSLLALEIGLFGRYKQVSFGGMNRSLLAIEIGLGVELCSCCIEAWAAEA